MRLAMGALFLNAGTEGGSSQRTGRRLPCSMRWEVEEFFKLSKGPYIGQGQFRSKSPSGVIQEIHALVLFLAISRLCMGTAAAASALDYSSVSQKAAVLGLAAYLTRILLAKNGVAGEQAGAVTGIMIQPRWRARGVARSRRSSCG